MVPFAAASFVSYTHEFKTKIWSYNGVYMTVWYFMLAYWAAFMHVFFFLDTLPFYVYMYIILAP